MGGREELRAADCGQGGERHARTGDGSESEAIRPAEWLSPIWRFRRLDFKQFCCCDNPRARALALQECSVASASPAPRQGTFLVKPV